MIKDNMQLSGFNNIKFPKLKGHIKLTLHNVHNGKNEVYEGENIVTNAVSDIMSANYLGCVDYSKMWGTDGIWKKWFGGVLAYETAHPNLDADKYFPYSESNNHLVAHAGQTTIDVDHDDDLRRGNPVNSDRIITENSIKQVWEWSTTHGNGNISALSLCHADVGDAGLGSTHYAFQNFNPLEQLQSSELTNITTGLGNKDTALAMYDDNHLLSFETGDGTGTGSEVYYYGHTVFDTNKITVKLYRLPYSKAGLFETTTARSTIARQFTVTTETDFVCQPAFYFDYTNKILWLFTNVSSISGSDQELVTHNSTTVRYCKIDCENETLIDLGSGVYEKTFVSDVADLAPIGLSLDVSRQWSGTRQFTWRIPKEGDYFCFPRTTGAKYRSPAPNYPCLNVNGYRRIKESTSANINPITFNDTQQNMSPIMYSDDFVISTNVVANGEVGYTCTTSPIIIPTQDSLVYSVWGVSTPTKPSSYLAIMGNNQYTNRPRYIVANKLLNTTKYNLPSTIQKTASQSMVVEYTIQEVAPST